MIRLTTEYEGRTMLVADAVKRGYLKRGWRFVEVIGRLTTNAVPGTQFSSPTARKITAVAHINGKPIKKVYIQKKNLILVVTMQRPTRKHSYDENTFVLVFSKPKPV
jgi:hypothetical protein